MPTASQQIHSVNEVICRNVDNLSDQRELLSQNLLAHLRNVVEAVIVLACGVPSMTGVTQLQWIGES